MTTNLFNRRIALSKVKRSLIERFSKSDQIKKSFNTLEEFYNLINDDTFRKNSQGSFNKVNNEDLTIEVNCNDEQFKIII